MQQRLLLPAHQHTSIQAFIDIFSEFAVGAKRVSAPRMQPAVTPLSLWEVNR